MTGAVVLVAVLRLGSPGGRVAHLRSTHPCSQVFIVPVQSRDTADVWVRVEKHRSTPVA